MVEITRAWVKAKLIKHFLPLGLFMALLVALSWPHPGREVSSWKGGDYGIIQTINVCTIFFVSGMTVKTEDIHAAMKAYPSMLYGLTMILLVTPMLGFVTLEIPFSPKEFSYGFTLFVCVPTTLTSGVSMVGNAKGNTVLALFLTVGSNMLGVVTVPFVLRLVMSNADVTLDAVALLIKLLLTIFLPLCIGKKHKVSLGIVNNGSLVLIVWQTCSSSANQILDQSFINILPVLAGGVIIHAVFFCVNGAGTEVLSRMGAMPWRERMAVWLLTSQKTLPVSMTILTYLNEDAVGDHGLVAIPMIIGHVSQLFIDSYISSVWGSAEDKKAKEENVESHLPKIDSSSPNTSSELKVMEINPLHNEQESNEV
mmetsp:Transcript_29402/g.40604  ORF Transcript_29402/g.40604 Transcript_29402/m.40604 type:complete len:368 (+) Transcript_29402:174-1277(+)